MRFVNTKTHTNALIIYLMRSGRREKRQITFSSPLSLVINLRDKCLLNMKYNYIMKIIV